ncbi:TonB-dependent receptor [Sphingobacterium sp. JUb56]|uniref:SusC/RagA family TonB-linked outer membrane protein n=1 Tax=Sphingobacterium sp. JUb56 TaxID=2587145 RepID=UPI00160E7C46|nr:TonB-dependent receptor [Sphingobacterium sp. JUb56]MBB2949536.1 TonB-linked SusC/RagA family outer membrane protein [Sphingobacterium sp. JUb56]
MNNVENCYRCFEKYPGVCRWKKLKLVFTFVFLMVLHVNANTFSQTISYSKSNVSLTDFLKVVKSKTNYNIIAKGNLLKGKVLKNVKLVNTPLEEALQQVLFPLDLQYIMEKKAIIIIEKKEDTRKMSVVTKVNYMPVQIAVPINQQEKIAVSGTVKDSLGTVISSVSVTVKGRSGIGTTTDQNGRYILDINKGETLIFRSVGYAALEIPNVEKPTLDVMLTSVNQGIEEVVVTGFGTTQKKESLVGAVTTISPKELKTSSSNLTTALQGRVAGMIAYQTSGEPGQDNAQFFIRGAASFGYKTEPLILIDGLELNSTDLARLQPNDIESFSILKDATSAAVYGARGANGVILVTTKRGREGKAILNFQLDRNTSAPTRNLELADPITYMIKANEAAINRSPEAVTPYFQSKIDATIAGMDPNLYPANDWMGMLLKKSTTNTKANMSIRGGGKVASYFVTGSMNTDNGILNVDKRNNFNNNIKLNSYSLRSNVDMKLTSSTDLAVRMYGNFDDYNGPLNGGSAVYSSIVNTNPVRFPAYYKPDEANEFTEHILFGNYQSSEGAGFYNNPYAEMVRGYQDYSRSLMLSQLELKQDLSEILLQGLKLRFMASTQRRSYFSINRKYNPYYYMLDEGSLMNGVYNLIQLNELTGSNTLDYTQSPKEVATSSYGELALNYDQVFADKHSVSALLVGILRNSIESSAKTTSLQTSLPYRNLGVSGRASYGYDSRYMIEVNFGLNGSERFHKDSRYGFFPSAGVAWNIANESFWKPMSDIVKQFKLRATYGFIGNDAIGGPEDRFFYLSDVQLNNPAMSYSFGENFTRNRPGVSINRYDNIFITWEKSRRLNLGMDLNIKDFTIVADYSTDHRTNILMNRAFIPSTMGLAAAVRANVGKAKSEAFEASVDYNKGFASGYWLGLRANFTYATNRYLVYEESEYPKGEEYRSVVGNPLSQGYGLIAERLFIDEEDIRNSPLQTYGEYMPGDIKFRDINRDGRITDADRVPLGFPTSPEVTVGFGFSMGYKGLDFSSFFSGLGRRSFWINYGATSPFIGDQRAFLKAYADDHWSEENKNLYALWPRLSSAVNNNNAQQSTWFMRDGSFLRLKQVELGYTLPEHWLSKLKISKLRVYVLGNNLLTFSKFKLWDVELGGNAFNYPIQRVYNFGINLTF